MTTRFKAHDLTEGLTGAIHETGHALYEQSRNLEYDGLPVNEVGTQSPPRRPETVTAPISHSLTDQDAHQPFPRPVRISHFDLVGFAA